MAEQSNAIDGAVAQQLLDVVVSYLPIFERPGYRFAVRIYSETEYELSSQAQVFIHKVCQLAHHLIASLPGRADSHQAELARRMLRKHRELCATTDLTVLCVALYFQVRHADLPRGGPGVLWWFESEHFLPLLRHIKELHASGRDQAR